MKTVNKVIYKEIWNNFFNLGAIAALMLMVVGFDAIAPWPFKILIDNVLAPNPISSESLFYSWFSGLNSRELLGFFAVFVYFISTFALAIVEYLRSVTAKRVIKKLTAEFSKKAFASLQSLAIGYFRKQQIGDYIYRLSYDVSALGELLELGVLPLVTSALYLVITTTIMFFINVRLTFISLIALPFLALGLYSFNKYIVYATKKSEFLSSAMFSFIEEALNHLKVIQAFSQEKRETVSFEGKVEKSLESESVLYRLDFLLSLLVAVIIAVSYSFIIVYGIRLVFSGILTTGFLVVFIFYLDNLTNPILSIIYAAEEIKQSYVKTARMEDFFSPKTHLKYKGKIQKITDTSIKFHRVSLKGDEGKYIVQNLSFEVEPRKRTVIFGPNGSGKTSIVNLIMRFIDKPSSGAIFLGGVKLQDYDVKTLHDAITFVPQEISLFNDTIKDNIAFGNPETSLRDIRQAARLAAADEFIKKLPGGYGFKVGEGGNLLSGGQRQRIMLARALIKKNSKILLFDETFSGLDVKGREEILENIYHFSHGKTTILVSNVFSIASAADNVIVLNKGRVIYSGPAWRLPKEIALYKMIIESDRVLESNSAI